MARADAEQLGRRRGRGPGRAQFEAQSSGNNAIQDGGTLLGWRRHPAAGTVAERGTLRMASPYNCHPVS